MTFELWIIFEKLKKGGNFGRKETFVKSFHFTYWKGFQYKYQYFFYEKQFFNAVFRSAEKMGAILDLHTLVFFYELKLGIL